MMEGEKIKVYTRNCLLIIDSKILRIRQIIPYQNIDSITITHVNETYDNEMIVSLSKPIKYENLGPFFLHKIIYAIYLLFRTNRNLVNISYSDNDLLLILNEIKNNLPNVNIPVSLDKSLFWNENSNNHNFSQVKLVYSKLNLSLFDVLKNTNKI
ncbi:hypothetical protein [Flavobacterium hercynium]|uniref:hypothetical protein n=1 Tax=Flavobacterium hercynium TaxID=387094 RepID=UPI0024032BA4|nr:hypothetical protein [Flavobacterium hercynium]SMP36910.1 hypothetical protein SAMN06265346_12527 [Flavobacterium hercynium]